MKQTLPAKERIHIFSRRVDNLRKGAGDYDASNRPLAIKEAEAALTKAVRDYRGFH